MKTSYEIFCEYKKAVPRSMYAVIESHDPFQFEEEFGTDFVHYTDKILSDLFICKFKMYSMKLMAPIFTKYKAFYQYCVEAGYRKNNPFNGETSIYLDWGYLQMASVDNGNVPLYSRDYILRTADRQAGAAPYYRAILLSLFEGVCSNLKELVEMDYAQVNFANEKIELSGKEKAVKISRELLEAYRDLHTMENLPVYKFKYNFTDDEKLIRRLASNSGVKGESARRGISKKIQSNCNLNITGIVESGDLAFLIGKLGKEKLIAMFCDEKTKSERGQVNKILEETLKERRELEGKAIIKNYRSYVLALKYGKIE